jgi:O-antigen/teichoic acid export membrane protein
LADARQPGITELESIKHLALKGSAWTVGGYAAEQILRLASNLIITRLLFPEAFGIVAIVWVAVHGLAMLSNIGVEHNVIRHTDGETASFLNTAWTIQICRGFLLWGFSLLIAHPLSDFYQEPLLRTLVPVAGLAAVCDGFSSTSIYVMNRRMKLAEITKLELIAYVFGLVIMNLWAWLYPTIFALVGSYVAARLLRTLLSHVMLPATSLRLEWHRAYSKDFFSFGKWVFLASIMAFLSAQTDRLILGKLIPLETLGVYFVAFTLASALKLMVQRISSKVIFPALVQQSHLSREVLRSRVFDARKYILIVLAIAVSVPVVFGDRIVALLYDDRYIQAGWMLSLLSLGLWPALVPLTVSPFLFVVAKPHYEAFGHGLRFIFMLACAPVGFWMIGLPGAILAIAAGYVPFYAAIALGLHKERLSNFRQDVTSTLLLVGAAILMVSFRLLCGWGSPLAELFQQGITRFAF